MAQQCDSILNLESAVRTVDTEVADQKAKTDELEYALTELEAQLARNMEEYKVEMSAQKLLLEEQSAIIAVRRNYLFFWPLTRSCALEIESSSSEP